MGRGGGGGSENVTQLSATSKCRKNVDYRILIANVKYKLMLNLVIFKHQHEDMQLSFELKVRVIQSSL